MADEACVARRQRFVKHQPHTETREWMPCACVALAWWAPWRLWCLCGGGEDGKESRRWIGSIRDLGSVHHLWLCCQCENNNVTRGALAVDVSTSGWTEEYGSSLFQLIAKTE